MPARAVEPGRRAERADAGDRTVAAHIDSEATVMTLGDTRPSSRRSSGPISQIKYPARNGPNTRSCLTCLRSVFPSARSTRYTPNAARKAASSTSGGRTEFNTDGLTRAGRGFLGVYRGLGAWPDPRTTGVIR